MKWITRERPKIDRIACPWLVARFIDPAAEFLFVAPEAVVHEAARLGEIPFDVPGVELTHDGPRCSSDAFLRKHALDDPALQRLARIVRAADTDRCGDAPEAPGLLAISLGLAKNLRDDQALLAAGFVVYDALYAWCQEPTPPRHGWDPDAIHQA